MYCPSGQNLYVCYLQKFYIMKNLYFLKYFILIFALSTFVLLNKVGAQCNNISISGLNTEYCIIDQESEIVGFPYGGTFSGPGITGSFFEPAIAGAGTHEIKYVFDSIYYEIDQTGTFNPITSPGNDVILSDDDVSSALSLGFTFNFFGVDYTEFYLSSNGFITFNSGSGSGCCEGQDLPNTNSPNNLIAFAWTDLNPNNIEGIFTYFTMGTEPNRVCVVNVNSLPYYNGGGIVTTQVKLFETSNTIEIHSTEIEANYYIKTMGVENEDGTIAYAVDNRNATQWNVINDFVKFTPVYCTDSTIQEVIVNDNPAEINLHNDHIMYGEIFLNDNPTENILITNIGCDTLHIDSLKNVESVYTYDNTPFYIMPGETGIISVTFTPTAMQEYLDTIWIYTNDLDTIVALNGEGIASPVMTLDKDTLEGSINNCSGTLDFTFNIQNSGDNNLEYNISSAILSDDFEDGDISDWTIDSEVNASVVSTVVGDGSYSLNLTGGYDWDFGSGMMQTFNSSQPNYISVMVYPDLDAQDNAIFVIGDDNALSDWGIIYFYYDVDDGHYFEISNASDYFYTMESRWYNFEFKNIDFTNETYDCYIDGDLYEEGISFYNSTDHVSEVHLSNYTNSSTHWDNVYIGYNNSWIDISPISGSINLSASEQVSVSFNAEGLNSGLYESTLLINSNDPDNRIDTVICILNKDGEPEINSSASAFDFGEVLVNDSTYLELTIKNIGCDTLFIDSLINSTTEFMVEDITPLELMPGDSSSINIYFKPSSVSNFTDNLIIYHTDATELIISLAGDGVDAPEMSVTPDTVKVNMGCDGLGSTSFTINNTGDGTLEFNVKSTYVNLEIISKNLDNNYTSVLNAIPNKYNFVYDGDEYYISDGGGDMYDDGNYLSTDIGGDIEYINEITESSYLGDKGRYFTREYDGLFVFAGSLDNISSFEINGNLGADSDGIVDGKILTLDHNGTTYYGLVKRVYSAGDPSVNHLFITDNPDVEQDFYTDTDDDYHQVYNLENVNALYYLLYSSQGGGFINDSQTLTIMEKLLDAINVSSDESTTITPSTGTINSGSSQVVDIDLTLKEINSGIFYSDFVISSNDPLNSLDTVVLELTVDGQAEIYIPTECIDFGMVAVTDSLERIVTISNTGCDTLFVNDIDGSISQYYAIDTVYEILPYDSANVSVYLKPDASAAFNATLDILTNLGSYQVCLTGEGVASFAEISVDSTSFKVTLECTPFIEAPIKISNAGEASLNFAISADESFIEFNEESGIVEYNESFFIDVKVIGSELPSGTYNANITISSNDPDSPDVIIPVTLNNISGAANEVMIDPRDSDICQGDILTLNAGLGFADYSWSTGESSSIIEVSETDRYIVIATDYNGCISEDSVDITVHNPTIDLAPTTEICMGDEITFDAGTGFSTYLWSNSSTDQTITVTTAGTYSVTVTDEYSCSDNASVELTVNDLPVIDLGDNEEICEGNEVTIDAGAGFSSYEWSNSATTQTITVGDAGKYIVIVTDANNCSNNDSIEIIVNSLPVVDLGDDVTISTEESVTLDAGAGFASYEWNDASTNQTLNVDGTTTGAGTFEYYVIVTDANTCSNSDTIIVTINVAEGINFLKMSKFVNIYPVPAKDYINLNFVTDYNENLIIELIDIAGSLIYRDQIDNILANEKYQIDVTKNSNGIYYIKIYNNKISSIEKVIIQK